MKKLRNYLIVVDKFTKPGFAQLLGTDPRTLLRGDANSTACNDSNTNDETKKNTMEMRQEYPYSFQYKIPKHACIPMQRRIHYIDNSKTSSPVHVLPLSGYLALFDEYSTFALMNEDRKTRPGVSLSLSARLGQRFLGLKDACKNVSTSINIAPKSPRYNNSLPCAGDEIEIQVRITKIGNIFGFAEARAICSKSGDIIASGKHIKYLPVGSIAQKIVLGLMLPLSAKIASLWENTISSPQADSTEERIRLQEPHDTMHDALSMNKDDILTVKDCHCNPMGSLHGGCQAMLMELIGDKVVSNQTENEYLTVISSNRNSDSNDNKEYTHCLESIHMTYMSQGKNNVTFQTEVDDRISSINSSSLDLNVKAFDSKGRTISEGVLRYQLLK